MRIVAGVIVVGTLAWGAFESLERFSAQFTQRVEGEHAATLSYKGELYAMRPSKVLWRYLSPIRKDIYINGNQIVIDEPDLEQATYASMDAEVDILALLQKAKAHTKGAFKATLEGQEYTIFTDSEETPVRIETIDALGHKTTIVFEAQQRNQKLQESLFEFTPPRHYDLISR